MKTQILTCYLASVLGATAAPAVAQVRDSYPTPAVSAPQVQNLQSIGDQADLDKVNEMVASAERNISQKQYDRADKLFIQALTLTSHMPNGLQSYAQVMNRWGDVTAFRDYRRALQRKTTAMGCFDRLPAASVVRVQAHLDMVNFYRTFHNEAGAIAEETTVRMIKAEAARLAAERLHTQQAQQFEQPFPHRRCPACGRG